MVTKSTVILNYVISIIWFLTGLVSLYAQSYTMAGLDFFLTVLYIVIAIVNTNKYKKQIA